MKLVSFNFVLFASLCLVSGQEEWITTELSVKDGKPGTDGDAVLFYNLEATLYNPRKNRLFREGFHGDLQITLAHPEYRDSWRLGVSNLYKLYETRKHQIHTSIEIPDNLNVTVVYTGRGEGKLGLNRLTLTPRFGRLDVRRGGRRCANFKDANLRDGPLNAIMSSKNC